MQGHNHIEQSVLKHQQDTDRARESKVAAVDNRFFLIGTRDLQFGIVNGKIPAVTLVRLLKCLNFDASPPN